MSKIYRAFPEQGPADCAGDVRIIIDDTDTGSLNPRRDLRDHSPTGFAWNYYGSGPAQLAIALLSDALDGAEDQVVAVLYQDFKSQVVAKLPQGTWDLAAADVEAWLAKARKERDL